MKAIVQTCDRYHSMCEHMMHKYQELWPSNTFTFRIPWNNEYPHKLSGKFDEKINLIQSELEFKKTFESLTGDLPGEEWIYWCIDDKYPARLEEEKCNKVFDFVEQIDDTNIVNVTFNFVREVKTSANRINSNDRGNNIIFNNLNFIEHKSYTNNWLHQFFRVKALREFWGNLSEPKKYQAASMDREVRPLNGKLLTLNEHISSYGESTYRGMITKNCFKSCNDLGIKLPTHFKKPLSRGILI